MPFHASSLLSPMWPPASEFHCGRTRTAARPAPAPAPLKGRPTRVVVVGRPFRAAGKDPAIHGVVRLVRRLERAWKRQQVAVRRRLQRVVRRRRRREERVGVRHHVRHPVADHIGRRRLGTVARAERRRRAVWRNPVESPLERADDAIFGDGGEVAFPGVEEGLKHPVPMLYCLPHALHPRHAKAFRP